MTDWIESRLLPLVMAFAIGALTGMDATERQMREAHPVTVAAIDCDDGSAQTADEARLIYVRAQ